MTIDPVSADRPALAVPSSRPDPMTGFAQHLADAVWVNLQRAPDYARRSRGDTWAISLRLIASEVLLLPAALAFDASSVAFARRGLRVITGDFPPMAPLRPSGAPIGRHAPLDESAWPALRRRIADDQQSLLRRAQEGDFWRVAGICAGLADTIDRFEADHPAQAAMTRHLVESIGWGAVHAIRARTQSRGETDRLYASFLTFQARGLPAGVDLDVAVHPLHCRGIGILTNDVPTIRFQEAWQTARRGRLPPILQPAARSRTTGQ